MNDMTHPSTPWGQTVGLTELYLHPLNTRTEPPALDISALADSIIACGLMQNLLAYADPEQPGQFGIVAGGRRLRALQLLAGAGQWSGPIPIWITDNVLTAQTWANAENTARAALNPADEIRAYGRMEATGAATLTIAKAFAVTEAHVKRRLKLAHLPDRALDALKAGILSYGQCAALTLSDDPARVADMTDTLLANPNWHENSIRQKMMLDTQISATDRRAKFVGLDLYEAEGGKSTRDLFTDQAWLHDESLLNKLFARQLREAAEQAQADGGWAIALWSDKGSPHDSDVLRGYEQTDPDPVDLPEGDQRELEELSETTDRTDEQELRLEELERRAAGSFDEDARASLGIFAYVGWGGKLAFIEGLRAKKPNPAAEPDGDSAPQPGSATPAPAEPDISQSLREDLLTIRRAALQTALLLKPELVLDLVAFSLHWGEAHSGYGMTGVKADRQNVTPSTPDGLTLVGALQDPDRSHDFRTATGADFTAFRTAEGAKKARNDILTRHFTRSVMAIPGDLTDTLESLTGAAIRAIWQPDVKNFFGRVSASMLVSIYAELLQPADDDERFSAFQAMKKRDMAQELDDLFHNLAVREAYGFDRETGTRIDSWVPQMMRPSL